MKKFLITLALLLAISPVFAQTIQCVKSYKVFSGFDNTNDVSPQLQIMVNQGWKVVSITPITRMRSGSNPTDYIIVVFEKEE